MVATQHSRTSLPALCTGNRPTNLSFSWLASLPKGRSTEHLVSSVAPHATMFSSREQLF